MSIHSKEPRKRSNKLVIAGTGSVAGVLAVAAAAYACTNYVGVVKLFGNVSTQNTVTVTGSQSAGEGSQAMTQWVSTATATADNESTGQFQMWAGANAAGWKLKNGTYNVNWLNDGYTSHTTWGPEPEGDCMNWTDPSNLGTVTITSGNITAGAGTFYLSYANNWVKFDLPTASANTNGHESGVCISDSGSVDGNQMPLKLV